MSDAARPGVGRHGGKVGTSGKRINAKVMAYRGRGALSNADGRFEAQRHEFCDDGWGRDEVLAPLATQVSFDRSRGILCRNDSPDVPFEQSINPYRGCEHGCVYCYARPSHAYLGLSPGLDFETRLFAKRNAAALLRAELARPGYRCRVISLGANTDPYQPIERRYRITREILEVLSECEHPLAIVTKSSLVERDIDLLSCLAARRLVKVYLSVTSLDRQLARRLEPRACAPARRLQTLEVLSAAGVPTGVLLAPLIPALNDAELEAILEASYAAGAREAAYVFLRLPHELKALFQEWLETHYPLRATHVMSLIRQSRGGRENDARFGSRMRGEGVFAELIAQRFGKACRRLGLNTRRLDLDEQRFRAPPPPNQDRQLTLF